MKFEHEKNTLATDPNYALFVGKNFNYYSVKWYKLLQSKCGGDLEKLKKHSAKHASFNICAFFFNILWFAYRKMYFKAALCLIIMCNLSFVHWSLSWVMAFVIGLYGNKFYFLQVSKKISKLQKEIQNPDILKSEIIKTGGTSKIGVFWFIVLCSVIAVLIAIMQIPSLQQGYQNATNQINNKPQIKKVPSSIKEAIESISVEDGTMKDLIGSLAGADGKVRWEAKDDGYYVYIDHSNDTDYLKFSYNESTEYVLLTGIKYRGKVVRKCSGSGCVELILFGNRLEEAFG